MTNPSIPNNENNSSWIDAVNFNSEGLVPAIAQDHITGDILMMAWMNSEALQLTADTKTAVYYSRSRKKLWHKGETSGHTQVVHNLFLDCDADVIVLSVTQIGGIACHTGRKSCFYRKLDLSGNTPTWAEAAPVLKDPNEIYGDKAEAETKASIDSQSEHQQIDAVSVLKHLDKVLDERKQADADSSYVASLYNKGINKILEKVGEEAVEAIIAAKDLATVTNELNNDSTNDKEQDLVDDLIYEIADVWFHTLVTLAWFNIGSDRILTELARRFGLSGIEEKNNRAS